MLSKMYTSCTTTLGGGFFTANLGSRRQLRKCCIGFVLIRWANAIQIKGVMHPRRLEDRLAPWDCMRLRGCNRRNVRSSLRLHLGVQQAHRRAIVWHIRRCVFIGSSRIGRRSCRVSWWTSERSGRAFHCDARCEMCGMRSENGLFTRPLVYR